MLGATLVLGAAPDTQPPVLGSLAISASVADLAAAAGVQRVDPSTLPLDIVRIAFSSPEGTEETRVRAAIASVLQRDGPAAGRLPLPLSPKTWTTQVFRASIPDRRLASKIFGTRSAALLYYGLMGIDPVTLAWIESNPAVLETLSRHPGVTAVYGRSLRIRQDRIVTPGDAADDVWAAVVGAPPGTPAAFIAKLWTARSGRLAGLYDAVAHLDPAHQALAIGSAADADRVARARDLLDALTTLDPQWRLAEHPFRRPDVDAAVLLRTVRVTPAGTLAPPASRDVWSRVFGGVVERGPLDAAWLARRILEGGDSVARQRLDQFRFAQRVFGGSPPHTDEGAIVEAVAAFGRYPALMLTLEGHGLDARAFVAASRTAAALQSRDAIALFQSGLAIVDRARRARTLDAERSRAAIASLVEAARSPEPGEGLISWVRTGLLAILRRSVPEGDALEPDALVIAAMAGPPSPPRPAIEWEAQQFRADLAGPERRRLIALRHIQDELSIEKALAAATPRDFGTLAHSMTALVYADALGEPDGQPAIAGAVWRRHRFEGVQGGDLGRPVAWRLATEVFAPEGWHLSGSLLRLDLALAHLTLRRVDASEMPTPGALPANSRRTLALSVALIDPRALADEDRDAIAAALSHGRARAAAVTDPSGIGGIAAEAGLSEWRANAARWALGVDSSSGIAPRLTLLELFRLGGGKDIAAWGTASVPLDGCLCLAFPPPLAWEDLAGRPGTGQIATQLADVLLRTADVLSARRLPALLARDLAAFAMQDAMDRARPAYFDDWLPLAYAARDLTDAQFDDYVAALTVAGPLVPLPKGVR